MRPAEKSHASSSQRGQEATGASRASSRSRPHCSPSPSRRKRAGVRSAGADGRRSPPHETSSSGFPMSSPPFESSSRPLNACVTPFVSKAGSARSKVDQPMGSADSPSTPNSEAAVAPLLDPLRRRAYPDPLCVLGRACWAVETEVTRSTTDPAWSLPAPTTLGRR